MTEEEAARYLTSIDPQSVKIDQANTIVDEVLE